MTKPSFLFFFYTSVDCAGFTLSLATDESVGWGDGETSASGAGEAEGSGEGSAEGEGEGSIIPLMARDGVVKSIYAPSSRFVFGKIFNNTEIL